MISKIFAASLLLASSFSAVAATNALTNPLTAAVDAAPQSDLVLPDARYLTQFNRYICRDFAEAGIAAPKALSDRGVVFEKFVGDGLIIQFLLTASFKEQNSVCHYSAILSRAVISKAMVKTASKAYSTDEGIDCSAGQAQIDALFTRSTFSYTTHPIRFIAVRIPADDAVEVCGAQSNGGIRLVFERVRK